MQSRILAILLALLLAAQEVAAMRSTQDQASVAVQRHAAAATSNGTWLPFGLTGIFGGSAVCRKTDFASAGKALERYLYKVRKVQESMKGLEESPSLGAAFEIKDRLKNFQSCVALENDPGMPLELKDTLVGSSDESMLAFFEGVVTKLFAVLKNGGWFKTSGACGFYPELMDLKEAIAKGAESGAVLQSQLFGEGCDEAAAAGYMAKLGNDERKLIGIRFDSAKEMLLILTNKTSEQQAADIAERIQREVSELDEQGERLRKQAGDSLMETSMEPWMIILIVVGTIVGLPIAVGLLHLIIMGVIAGLAFSGVGSAAASER